MHTTEIQALVLQFKRLVHMNLKQHFVHVVTMTFKNGISCETYFVENVLEVRSFFSETHNLVAEQTKIALLLLAYAHPEKSKHGIAYLVPALL